MYKRKINVNEYQKIVDLYRSGVSSSKIALLYNVTIGTICNILEKCKVSRRNQHLAQQKYSLNEHYFDVIDSEDKAYFLGFLYADGCVEKRSENSYRVKINLKDADRYILERFANCLETKQPIHSYISKCSIGYGNKYSSLTVNSLILAKSLINKGCFECKSLILKFPDRKLFKNPDLIRHFIRGYFDGDGSVFISNEKHWRHGKIFPVIHFRFCGTKWFCSELQTILNIGGRLSHPKKAHKDFVELAYKRNKKAKYFFNYLYKDATIYLKRKYDIFYNHLKQLERGSETIIS